MIVILDYGMGNLGSIKNMLRKIGHDSLISSEMTAIGDASKLILPGVGAFDTGMAQLEELGLREVLERKVLTEQVPILGICLGAQLMCRRSEEGSAAGLGWFDADVLSFRKQFEKEGSQLRSPNMGWLDTRIEQDHALTRDLDPDLRFYYVHSYYIKAHREEEKLFSTYYGFDYTAGLCKANIYGVQFHPEKSHRYGFQLLRNFAAIS